MTNEIITDEDNGDEDEPTVYTAENISEIVYCDVLNTVGEDGVELTDEVRDELLKAIQKSLSYIDFIAAEERICPRCKRPYNHKPT